MRVCLMIEGQEDVTWDQWVALARACEETGIEALFRSDHYLSVEGKGGRGSLDAWATLNALAAITSRLRLGTLVSPATFRHPSVLAKMVVTADHVSGGRVELGLGAGWLEAEHRAYGFPFAGTRTRMDVLAEQLEIVHRSWKPGPFSFHGEHYTLEELDALPKPVQQPHPPLIVGGTAKPGTVEPAVRWADEYNTIGAPPDEIRERRRTLDDACRAAGRDPETLPLSMMRTCLLGEDEAELRDRAARFVETLGRDESVDELLRDDDRWRLIGTVEQVAERLAEYEAAGVTRVMLQHLVHEDVDAVALLGRLVR
jgi:F420-dependent oxidoreductase-like protein